jgi:hypothetical protein
MAHDIQMWFSPQDERYRKDSIQMLLPFERSTCTLFDESKEKWINHQETWHVLALRDGRKSMEIQGRVS